jgi:hypothetical protein
MQSFVLNKTKTKTNKQTKKQKNGNRKMVDPGETF